MTEPTKVQAAPIEGLPLPERIKQAESYNPYNELKSGCYIDARDTVNNWCVAEVLKIDSNEVRVSYDGWSDKYNEVMW